jgi:thymidylate kinase
MKSLADLLNRLSIHLESDDSNEKLVEVTLLYINNRDGSIRWIWPAQLKRALFLKFYAQDSFRSKVIALLFHTLFALRLQSLVFKSLKGYFSKEKALLDLTGTDWALFTGTPGPNRKALVFLRAASGDCFIKVAMGKASHQLLQQESKAIQYLNHLSTKAFNHPQLLECQSDYIVLSDISNSAKRSKTINAKHLRAIASLNQYSSQRYTLGDLPLWKQSRAVLDQLQACSETRFSKRLLDKLESLFQQMNPALLIETGRIHGDFTPWNMFENDQMLHLYDWELSQEAAPVGYDLYHFICQQGILVDHLDARQILEQIQHRIPTEALKTLSPKIETPSTVYFQLYLLFNTIHYLNIFSMQEEWHAQVYDLLATWEALISSQLETTSSNRAILIKDLFHFLEDEKYAAIKFPHISPENLSLYSDIDLSMSPKVALQLTQLIQQHSLVRKVRQVRKSFMWTLDIALADGGKLALDLLFILKRKSVVLSDLRALTASARLNKYGVKLPSEIELARYIMLFYGSNHTSIPAKYSMYVPFVRESSESSDKALYEFYSNSLSGIQAKNQTMVSPALNRGWSRAKNIFFYLLDTLKGMGFDKGMIITFSGVDGAGKSTIIEEVKGKLEKQYRKRVVVIRHRPSMLPILSAYTKGKTQAEEEAKNTLPRQGSNKSYLSSLLRFTYYYVDYFIGQFVIYYKHVLRGHIVLYDRYYFDFINDSKRSNIQLPKFITKLGYYFLLKPHFNFFLYAQPEIILSRKKELDHQTILRLTHSYKDLFEGLDQRTEKVIYRNIENLDLQDTLDSIFSTLQQKAA